MSEKEQAKVATKDDKKKTEKSDKVVGRVEPKVLKARWTLERCQKYARRFPNEAAWASSASASYKSAVAHGWKDACLAQQGKTQTHSTFKKAA